MINTARKRDWSYIAWTLEQEQKKKCSRSNFLDELAPKRLRMLRRLPPHKSSNSYKMTNVSVEMRDKCMGAFHLGKKPGNFGGSKSGIYDW